jgi:DNA-binding transcriptional ArsR family regulator
MMAADTMLAPDVIELRRFLEVAADLGQIHLVAIRPDSDEIAGRDFGCDIDAAESWAINKNRAGLGVYWSPNAIAPGVHKKPGKGDVTRARFVHVDLDPPKGAAWTPAERAAALERLQDCQPHPSMIVDSGGGFNAYWRLEDECRDADTIEGINRALCDKLGADACWNIDRILRVAGTVNWPNAKKAAAGRQPRLAEVVEEEGGEYSVEALRAAFGWLPANAGQAAPTAKVQIPASIRTVTPDSIGLWPEHPLRSGLAVAGDDRSKHGFMVIREAVQWMLTDALIFGLMLNPDIPAAAHFVEKGGVRGVSRCIAKARGELEIPSPAEFIPVDVPGSIRAIMDNYRMKLNAEQGKPAAGSQDGERANGQSLDGIVRLADLMRMEFPEIKYRVPGYIAEGLTVLAGAPKIGKSWLALNLAVAVAGGTQALGSIQCPQADVLYIALEDNPRRMQKRAKILQCPIPEALEVEFDWPLIGAGCEDRIRQWAANSANPGMVVIDVFNRVRPPKKGSAQQYDVDYQDMAPLQKLAGELGLAIVLVHHTRKMQAEDPFDTVSGTRGITGAADTILVLFQRADAILPALYGRGRDIEEIEKAVQFNSAFGTWLLAGEITLVASTKERTDIIRALRDAGAVMSTGEIAKALDKKVDNISHQLKALLGEGKVKSAGYGKWTLP